MFFEEDAPEIRQWDKRIQSHFNATSDIFYQRLVLRISSSLIDSYLDVTKGSILLHDILITEQILFLGERMPAVCKISFIFEANAAHVVIHCTIFLRLPLFGLLLSEFSQVDLRGQANI